jgi:hypothetical protein
MNEQNAEDGSDFSRDVLKLWNSKIVDVPGPAQLLIETGIYNEKTCTVEWTVLGVVHSEREAKLMVERADKMKLPEGPVFKLLRYRSVPNLAWRAA